MIFRYSALTMALAWLLAPIGFLHSFYQAETDGKPAKELTRLMAMTLNLRADRELWKYIYINFPFASSLHLSVLPDYNHVWAEQLYREDPTLHSELLTPRHLRIIRAVERQGRAMGLQMQKPTVVKARELAGRS